MVKEVFQSAPLSRGETRHRMDVCGGDLFQSTPLTRGETETLESKRASGKFQSTPLTRGETRWKEQLLRKAIFQSTPLTRGETNAVSPSRAPATISIHSPHTRGDYLCRMGCQGELISIHSPHTRGDVQRVKDLSRDDSISIHSPHTRGDCSSPYAHAGGLNFNPLPSHEGRLNRHPSVFVPFQFQSAPLSRGETLQSSWR